MAFNDISMMHNVEQFSNLVVPMVWFDIVSNLQILLDIKDNLIFSHLHPKNMIELPVSLQNRFNLYLNILPIGERVLLWGSLACGILLLLIAVTRASMRLSKAITPSHKISKQPSVHGYSTVKMGSIYRPCEQQLIERKCDMPSEEQPQCGEDNYMLEPLDEDEESDSGQSWTPEATYQNDSEYEVGLNLSHDNGSSRSCAQGRNFNLRKHMINASANHNADLLM